MVNKTYILSTICFLLAASLSAQEEDRRDKLDFGIRAGFNVSNVWDAKTQEFKADPKAGLAGGLFVGIPIGKFLGIQPEVLVSQKGFKASGTMLGSSYEIKRTTTYLDIPLQLQVKPIKYITVVLGPQFSYLLYQKDKYTFGSMSTEQEQEFKNENIRKNILGFVGGFDLIYKRIVFSSRAGWDFIANKGDGTSLTPRYKNQWLQFTLGFKI